jgi:hypothetical protein
MKKLVLLLTIVTLFGCRKDDVNESPQFIVGVISENSVYKKFDPAIQLFPSNNMYSFNDLQDTIDVDNDGQDDFILLCQNELNNNTLDKESYIIVINEKFEIAYSNIIDTNNIYIIKRNDSIYGYQYSYFKPFNLPGVDTLKKEYYETSEPVICKIGTRPSDINEWSTYNNLYFAEKDSSEYQWENLKHIRYTNIEKGIWNGIGKKYLVYRTKKDDNLVYYGWLKVEISNFCNMQIFESCFQKDGFPK